MDVATAAALVDERLVAFRSEHDIPGVAYGLLKDGELVHSGGVGSVDLAGGRTPGERDILRIASMTKSFTAASVLLLRDRGVLRLDDPISTYLPWTAQLGSPDGGPPISIRDLLSMNGGLPTDDPWGDRLEAQPIEEFDALVAGGLSFARPPRTGFEYSNLGYALLGRVITVASGVDYRAFVHDEILVPLGMSDTSYDEAFVPTEQFVPGFAPVDAGLVVEPPTGPGAFSPMGGLHSSVRDLALWVGGFQRAWTSQPRHPLDRWSLRELQEPHRLVGTTVSPVTADSAQRVVTSSYCFGLASDDDQALGRFVSHSGGYPGYGSHMRWHPATGWGFIALGNRTYAPCYRVGTDVMNEIVAGALAASPLDPGVDLWPATRAAMDAVESLLRSWDDALADRWFAPNVDLDRPRSERAAEFRRTADALGTFTRSSRLVESSSPAQVRWWLDGAGGLATVDVLLSPEREPRIQSVRTAAGEAPPLR
jgi:CubicO group peptidase (beta-lactamase class C family)